MSLRRHSLSNPFDESEPPPSSNPADVDPAAIVDDIFSPAARREPQTPAAPAAASVADDSLRDESLAVPPLTAMPAMPVLTKSGGTVAEAPASAGTGDEVARQHYHDALEVSRWCPRTTALSLY